MILDREKPDGELEKPGVRGGFDEYFSMLADGQSLLLGSYEPLIPSSSGHEVDMNRVPKQDHGSRLEPVVLRVVGGEPEMDGVVVNIKEAGRYRLRIWKEARWWSLTEQERRSHGAYRFGTGWASLTREED
jgi:hypothetical protein